VLSVPLDTDGLLEHLGGVVGESSGVFGGHEVAAIAPLLAGSWNLHSTS